MASSQKVKSGTEQQVELWIELKESVDLVYKQLNQYRGACRSVDRLNRAVRRTDGQLNPDRILAEFIKFERDYRVSRKRLRKLDRQLLAVNLYDKLYDLYESLVIEESIGTGGDLIDSSAIDKAVVDEVGCNGPLGIEDTPVDDFAGISIDHDIQIDVEMDLMEDACLEPRQSATLNHSINNSSTDLSQFSSILVADASTRVTRQQTRRMVCNDSSAIVVGCNGPVGIEDNSGNDIAGTERPFKCSQCDKSFKTSYHLFRHKRTHKRQLRFKCRWKGCNYGTNRSVNFKDHQTVHSDERPFQCPLCDKSFKTSYVLSDHKRTHESKLRFKCSWKGCDFRANSNKYLKKHMIVHSDERPYQCNQCDKSFKTSSVLWNHKRTHESEPRFKCRWKGCDYGTYRNDKLKAHQTVHTGKFKFKCSWKGCGYGTYYKEHLKSHQTVHSDERPIQCPQCDKSFKTSNVLSKHMRTHESEPKFKCSWKGCGYCTDRKDHLKSHQIVHSDERPFQCPQCDKSFKTSSDLTRHKLTHESEPRFKCSWEGCDFGSHQLVNLTNHQTVHTGERSFQCPQCDKSFKTSSHLSSHKRSHESEPKFKCSWKGCGYRTDRKDHLKSHQTVHSDERPFQCPQCDKTFKTSHVLSKHKRTHDSNVTRT